MRRTDLSCLTHQTNAPQGLWRIPNNINVLDFQGDPNKPGAIPEGVDPALLNIYAQGSTTPKFAGQELLPAANNWGQNPYWSTRQFIASDIRDRVNASAQLRYDFTEYLYASGRIAMDWFARAADNLNPEGTGHDLVGSRNKADVQNREINLEGIIGFNKTFGKFNVNVFVGGNRMRRQYEYLQGSGSGIQCSILPIPEQHKIANL